MKKLGLGLMVLAASLLAASAGAADGEWKQGNPGVKSAGPLAFGPDGVLFLGDTAGGAVFAIDTGDVKGEADPEQVEVEAINEKIAGLLGVDAGEVSIVDLAVNPASGTVYFSVARGNGPDAMPVLVRLVDKKPQVIPLNDVKYSKAALPNLPAPGGEGRRNLRAQSITDLAFVDGRLFVAGLSNEEFASNLRSIPFPFADTGKGTSVEIFHGAHGRFETRSPVRTFVAYEIGNDPYLLAAYTCTPLVKLSVADLKPGVKVEGTTVAELGNRNRPLDMIVYQKGGKSYLLLANSSRGVMKITTDGIEKAIGIKERIAGTAGLKYDTIDGLKGVTQLDRLTGTHAVILTQSEDGSQDLKAIELP